MRQLRGSIAASIVLAAACGSDDPITADALAQSQDHATADGGKGSKTADAGVASASKADGGTPGTGSGSGTGTSNGTNGGTKSDPTNCGKSGFSTGAVIPDMLIVLDRSGSMKPATNTVTLRCDGTPDFATQLACSLAGIDCSSAMWSNTVNCGGTATNGPVDRWDPSVQAIESLTTQFDTTVSFGLMTFPASNNQCGPGDLQVPIDTGNAAKIKQVLDRTQPGGGTPTGETLQAALQLFQQNPVGADSVAPTQYVLLVTDGQPTCPNGNGGSNGGKNAVNADLKFTLDAIDALLNNGIKTFVVGYDAALDQTFSDALTQMAVHGGTDMYYPVQNAQSLTTAFSSISQKVVTCSFDFKMDVSDPRLIHVTLDGNTLKPDDPDGWTISGKTVTVQGASCDALQSGAGHRVEIVLECEPVVYI